MCEKLHYCNPRIDKCMREIVEKINKEGIYRTLASCCGHGKYPKTIVVKERETGNISEYYTKIRLKVKKRNRYYKKDNEGFYFIPKLKGIERSDDLMELEEMKNIINSFDNPDPELLDDLPKIREIIKRNHVLLHKLSDKFNEREEQDDPYKDVRRFLQKKVPTAVEPDDEKAEYIEEQEEKPCYKKERVR